MSHKITFCPSGRGKAQCAPNPEYLNGIAVNIATPGVKACLVELPYPAPECGHFVVECDECDMSIAITATGRPDDPISVRIPCKLKRENCN